jgi:hypothetical protein
MALDVQKNLEAALEAAASETETEESSPEGGVEETEEKATGTKATETELKSKGRDHKGANSRIQDLLAEKKEFEEKFGTLEQTVAARDTEIGKLVDLLELRDGDAATIRRINEIHQTNPEMKDLLETLNEQIQGNEVDWSKVTLPGKTEVTKDGETKGEANALLKAQELIESHQREVDEALADQQDELTLHKADILTDNYIKELPEEYNEEDQFRIRSVLAHHIDWDAIEQDPAVLGNEFAEGFQKCLDWYGTPHGKAASASRDESDENQTKAEPMTEKRIVDFAKQDWAKMKEITTPAGKTINVAEVDDDEYSQALSQMLKAANALQD